MEKLRSVRRGREQKKRRGEGELFDGIATSKNR
jgi:hypothetical protein